MKYLLLLFALFLISAHCQAREKQADCVNDILQIYTENISVEKANVENEMKSLNESIQSTTYNIEEYIEKQVTQLNKTRENLKITEVKAIGESLAKKKSITDCIQILNIESKILNILQNVVFEFCKEKSQIASIQNYVKNMSIISEKLDLVLPECVTIHPFNCDRKKYCIFNEIKIQQGNLDHEISYVQENLKLIEDGSMNCSDSTQSTIAFHLNLAQNGFQKCVDEILKN